MAPNGGSDAGVIPTFARTRWAWAGRLGELEVCVEGHLVLRFWNILNVFRGLVVLAKN